MIIYSSGQTTLFSSHKGITLSADDAIYLIAISATRAVWMENPMLEEIVTMIGKSKREI